MIKKQKLYMYSSHQDKKVIARLKLTNAFIQPIPTAASISMFDEMLKFYDFLENIMKKSRRRFTNPQPMDIYGIEEYGYKSPHLSSVVSSPSKDITYALEIIRESKIWCIGFISFDDMIQWMIALNSQSSVQKTNEAFDVLEERISAIEGSRSHIEEEHYFKMQSLENFLRYQSGMEKFMDFLVMIF